MKRAEPEDVFLRTTPLVYSLVTSLDEKNQPNVMGVSWVMRTSFDPFLMAVSIGTARYSHDGIARNPEFVIQYPTQAQAKGAWICGTRSGRQGPGKIEAAGFTLVPSQAVRVPTIDGVAAALECRVKDRWPSGDHTIFVGEVVAASLGAQPSEHLYVGSDFRLFPLRGAE